MCMYITLPKKPEVIKKDRFHATIEIENLYPGYGMTLGNALRRVLLSSLEGSAATLVKIKGASHEFSTIPNVMEDVVEILLNIKKLRFKLHSEEPQKVHIKVHGEKKVTAKDIEAPSQVEVVNTDAHIATLTDKKADFEAEITIERGFGYVPVENRRKEKLDIGTIALDAIFTPLRKVNYEVENMRVGERTDFDRLRFFIETDGIIDPEEAFTKAARTLVDQFQELIAMKESAPAQEGVEPDEKEKKEESGEKEKDGDALKTKVSDLALGSRAMRALEEAGIKTVSGLIRKTESDILALEGMGEKGVSEIKKVLKKLGVSLKTEE
ncbi:DNA-directed RNA polymerase subunit alpha [Candidatus Azambacteria bacterium RIFCSPHIGHO2_02_FULL_52_12]|uniref:DNA-directed RNA polymerase subunit alpha n=1 Tax=Candidatus Azambacteria bacterium RIFCSPLOWO2_01_FULL_46_25 TaxID=1797298 RepID=A0A1F5BTG7_9BACT|nr:MAG: DNA-directed RNA polymerase subunit alpha [Candidatus Azambacteria bacterium RIFCSPHIGHO2_02_FULL_52_12]OGD33892.1 MAG: DNA-directed RNA polymerase subunit alpha [Candidatus Azambacteria bacterium RIFCSPLOWO2_01_FULL_46_25]OGD37958.1 MAG: DNA-directed RNA polymerase subunit alpha [Candidatus Azambacteria bacterium RIFCSPHIGHO2_01_FULL_51_74]